MRLHMSRKVVIGLLAVVTFAGCDFFADRPFEPDAQWHQRTLVDSHLAHWLAVAPSESGFLHWNVTRTWQRREQKNTDLVAQSRLVYVLLSGYELTGDPRYLDGARRGADFLLRHFRDPVHGGFYRVVGADGRVVADAKFSYGNAFAVFALAHVYRVTRDDPYREAALSAWRAVSFGLRDPGGGFRLSSARDFGKVAGLRSLNSNMHLFEAALALHDATGDAEALAGARGIGDFLIRRMLQGKPDGTAYFAEWYDEKWEPQAQSAGGYIDLGHQMEMAYLLDVAGTRGLSPLYSAVAQRVLDYSIKVGYDETEGGCYIRAFADGTVVREKGWWQQSECLRTLMRYAAVYDKPDMKRRYEQTLAFVRTEFVDAVNGGWFPRTKAECSRSPCRDEQPDAYHMTTMHREAFDLAARAKADR